MEVDMPSVDGTGKIGKEGEEKLFFKKNLCENRNGITKFGRYGQLNIKINNGPESPRAQ